MLVHFISIREIGSEGDKDDDGGWRTNGGGRCQLVLVGACWCLLEHPKYQAGYQIRTSKVYLLQ